MKYEYDVVYIKRRDMSKFAQELKAVLNRASTEIWDIVRWDVEPSGHLLVLRKTVGEEAVARISGGEGVPMPAEIQQLLASLSQARPPKFSAATAEFFNSVMEEVGGFEKKLILEKMGKAVTNRRMINDKLRPIVAELKLAREAHMRGHDSDPCDFVFALDTLIEHAERVVSLGVS